MSHPPVSRVGRAGVMFLGLFLGMLPGAASAERGIERVMPLDASRMDGTLTPYNIAAEVTVSQETIDALLGKPVAVSLYPLPAPAAPEAPAADGVPETGTATGIDAEEDALEAEENAGQRIEMAPVDFKGEPLIKLKKDRQPPAPDIGIRLAPEPARVTLGSGDGATTWPPESGPPIDGVQALTHDTMLGGQSSNQMDRYREFAERAATYPVVLATAGSRMLIAHSGFQVVQKRTTTYGNGAKTTNRDWGFRTSILEVDLSQVTDEPLDSYRIVLSQIQTEKKLSFMTGGAAGGQGAYQVWLLPLRADGTFDPERFGFKMMVSSEITNTVGNRNIASTTYTRSVGLVTRVKLEGTEPTSKPPPAGTVTIRVDPGSDSDPLLQRPPGASEPTPWGVSLSGGGGYGGDIGLGDFGPMGVGGLSAWYGSIQVNVGHSTSYTLGSGSYRFGAGRDTNYIGVGLSGGRFGESFGAGPSVVWSRHRRFQGILLVREGMFGFLFAEENGLVFRQSYAVRRHIGNGVVLLPGGFLDLATAPARESGDSFFDARLGLRLKVVLNGNAGG